MSKQDTRTEEGAPRQAADNGGAGETIAAEMERLQAELAEARDRTLRVQAELENFRRRSRRELEDERRYANSPLLRDLLPVLDNIDRAIDAAQTTQDASSLLEGIRMVRQQLATTLEQHHCKEILALGEPFDPNLHEAITMRASADQPENTVLQVVQIGYQLHDRVIRPSQVIVSTPERSE